MPPSPTPQPIEPSLEGRVRYLEIHVGLVEQQLARVSGRLRELLEALAEVADKEMRPK